MQANNCKVLPNIGLTYNKFLPSFCTHIVMAQWWLSTIQSVFYYELTKTRLVNTYCFVTSLYSANGVEWSKECTCHTYII